MSLLAELKRRNVIRMAGLYLVGAWLLVQVAGTLLPVFEAPAWVMKTLVGVLAVGFVPALIFSWVFELTPEGIKRDAEVPLEKSIAPQTARRMDRTIIVVLLLALAYFAVDKFVLAPRRAATVAEAGGKAGAAPAGAVDASSIAVLPFVNMSGDPANEYFSDGITEEILNALAQIPELKVAARTSAFAFKGKGEDLRRVGETLGVAHVLEGSVQRAGDDVRITAQLIDARNGYHLWSERYDRKVTNLFAIEDEISKAIAGKLQLQLGAARGGAYGQTGSAEAHELYLKGLTLIAARGPGLRDASAALERAVSLDPAYAQAWGALAQTEMLLPGYGLDTTAASLPRAEAAAARALAIDPGTPSAHVAQGEIRTYRRQWAEAEQSYRRAVALAPGDVEVNNQYAQFLGAIGQHEAALRQIDRALELDPLSAIVGIVRAVVLASLHRDDEATTQFDATLRAHPDFAVGHWSALIHEAHRGRYAEAEAHARAVSRITGIEPETMVGLVRGMAGPAQREAAIAFVHLAIESNAGTADECVAALLYALLGQRERGLAAVEAFAESPGPAFTGIFWMGALDPLRQEPRYLAALKRMNLPYRSTAGSGP